MWECRSHAFPPHYTPGCKVNVKPLLFAFSSSAWPHAPEFTLGPSRLCFPALRRVPDYSCIPSVGFIGGCRRLFDWLFVPRINAWCPCS